MKWFYIMCSLLLFACGQDDTINPDEEVSPPDIPESVNLSALKVGQESNFLFYNGSCEVYPEGIEFSGDTLVWKVTSVTDNEFILKEYFSSRSPLAQYTDTVSIPVTWREDYILMPDRSQSNLFFFYGNDTLHHRPTPNVTLIQDRCLFLYDVDNGEAVFNGNDIAWVNNASFGQQDLQDQVVVSCVPNDFSINAYILYNEGIISSIHSYELFNPENSSGWLPLQ